MTEVAVNPDVETNETSVVNPDGTFAENWHEKYGKENEPHLSRYKDFDALVKSTIATKKKFGQYGRDPDSLIELPKDDSSDEVKAAFHKARGVPETIDGYKFERSPDVPANIEISDGTLNAFKEISKRRNIPQADFNGIVNDYLVMIGKDAEAFDAEMAQEKQRKTEEGIKVLEAILGKAAKQRSAQANAILDKYGLDVIKMPDGNEGTIKGLLLEEHPDLLTSPYFTLLLDRWAQCLSPDTIRNLGDRSSSVANIQSQIADVRAQMDAIVEANPANFKANAKYKELTEKKRALYKQMQTKK